jgi:hypothetical protein
VKTLIPLIKTPKGQILVAPNPQHWPLVVLQMGLIQESIDIEYRVSDYKFQRSIGVSILNTGTEVSEYRISNTEKSIECPALENSDVVAAVLLMMLHLASFAI